MCIRDRNYTPSGVSQLVTALETELNVTLLHRTKKGVSLTNDGKHFVPVVRSLVGEENRLYELASQVNGLLIGSISIATYSSVAVDWLPKIIRRFRETYPQIQFKFHEGTWQELSRQLDDRRADLAFFSHRDPMPYDWIPLAEIPLLAILPRSHPLAGAGVFPIQQYRRETLIIPDLKQVSDCLLYTSTRSSPQLPQLRRLLLQLQRQLLRIHRTPPRKPLLTRLTLIQITL